LPQKPFALQQLPNVLPGHIRPCEPPQEPSTLIIEELAKHVPNEVWQSAPQ